MIGIINYGSGNILAIHNLFRTVDIESVVVDEPSKLRECHRIILPGVGAFDATMRELEASGFRDELEIHVKEKGKPCLGVCVGMQILASSSDEGTMQGLGWIEGAVKRIPDLVGAEYVGPRLPHMGWNSVAPVAQHPLFVGVDPVRGFYFLHSYYFDLAEARHVTALADYLGFRFTCAVRKDNVFGVQFHPEKSHKNGVLVLKNFAEYKE